VKKKSAAAVPVSISSCLPWHGKKAIIKRTKTKLEMFVEVIIVDYV
jgi:hypothetical protein